MSKFRKSMKIVAVFLITLLVSIAAVSCNSEKGNQSNKESQPVKLGHFELVEKLEAEEITLLQEIVDMYGDPFETEDVRGDENTKRYFFDFGPKKDLVLHARVPGGKITGHEIVNTYN